MLIYKNNKAGLLTKHPNRKAQTVLNQQAHRPALNGKALKKFGTALTLFWFWFGLAVQAQQPAISDEDLLAVAFAEQALNSIRSAQGRFIQSSSNGGSAGR